MENLLVMYHYIRDNTKFKAFSTKEFRKQIEYLMIDKQITDFDDLMKAKDKETCILTFDDGLRDSYTNAFPIMQEYGITGTVFIPMRILIDRDYILPAQKRHILLAELGTKKFINEFNKYTTDTTRVKDMGIYNEFDGTLTSSLKLTLDKIDRCTCDDILGKIMCNYNLFKKYKNMYLTIDDIKEMMDYGIEIGVHGYDHLHLGKLNCYPMYEDLKKSVISYKKIFGKKPKYISYPFGSYDAYTKRYVKELGFKAGITINKEFNFDLRNRYELGRFDCTYVYPRGRL